MFIKWTCLLLAFIFYYVRTIEAGTFSVDYTNDVFLKDGQPFRYLSGSIHYMRVHPGLWNDRLQRLRALGFNAVQVYVPWNLHEPTEGNFDFETLNLTEFLTLAQQNGLYVLLRPGPYICAEWELGGFPWWLNKYETITTRDNEPTYISKVQNYYNKLLDLVVPLLYKNGGPILTIQVENEYGYAGHCSRDYMVWLRDLIRSKVGNETLLTTVDGSCCLGCGTVPETFATVDFGVSSDSSIDSNFGAQRKHNNGGPAVCTEFWVNWFTSWGQTNGNSPNPASVVENLNYMYYHWNASVNFYMVHGGTNFGFMNGAGITTSYDYGALIAENGDITPAYTAVHAWVKNITNWPQPPLPIPANNPATNYGNVTLQRIGSNLISTLTRIQETCQQNQDPIDFEQLNHGYGYVLYTTTLANGGKNLTTPNIRDFGYVFVNNVQQNTNGFVLGDKSKYSIAINAQPGDVLRILVENHGRGDNGVTSYDNKKGLKENVSLDGVPLKNWYSCGISLTKASIDSLSTSFFAENNEVVLPDKAVSAPGVYIGQFSADVLTDTFFDSRGWGKGQLFINGYNLGRYWPLAGPQMTLYVPKPYIQKTNTILLIELNGAQQNYANFSDHTVWTN